MSNVEETARDWYAEGLRIGAECREKHILYMLEQEVARTSGGVFNATKVLAKLIETIKTENK